MEVYQNLIISRSLYRVSIYQISGEYFECFLSYHPDKQNPVFGHVTSLIGWNVMAPNSENFPRATKYMCQVWRNSIH